MKRDYSSGKRVPVTGGAGFLGLHLTVIEPQLVHLPLPADDPKQRQPDITRARIHLDWEPAEELAKALQSTIAYFCGRAES